MVGQRGVVYMRTTRGAYPVLYGSEESFPVGGSKTVVSSGHDEVTLLAAGVTVHTCLSAADRLSHEGVPVRVIDLYSVKPIDATGLESAVNSTKGRVVIVEDHHPEGGLGEAVLSALASTGTPVALEHLAVRNMPTSGLADEMMFEARIGLFDVITAVHRLMNAYPHGVRTQFERDDTQGDVA
jgi:transketolase